MTTLAGSPARSDGAVIRRREEELRLVRPVPALLDSYLDTCRESFHAVHNSYILHDPELFPRWKATIFADYGNQERGIGLPDGFVPSATFWLVKGERVIGAVNLRLKLNAVLEDYGGHAGVFIRPSERGKGYASRIFPSILEKARELGISPVLFTCVESNTASLRMLQSFPCDRAESVETFADGVFRRVRRFWFT